MSNLFLLTNDHAFVLQMHALQYAEEEQQVIEIRSYDIKEAQLTKNMGMLLYLEVCFSW